MVHLVLLHPGTSCSSVSFVLAAFGSALTEVLMEPSETGAEGTVRTLVQVLRVLQVNVAGQETFQHEGLTALFAGVWFRDVVLAADVPQ